MMKSLDVPNPNAAGIDIGTEMIFISVSGLPVRKFSTFTENLIEACVYLKENKVTTVAMESTGVYWIPLYDLIEKSNIEIFVVNGAHVKNVPGRKSDVQDCQWIQQLHSYGLLQSSFVPDNTIRKLRTYIRLRDDHIEMASAHKLHLQKAFNLMNVKIHNVISDITGTSGMNIIRAIVQGERDANSLVSLCNQQILNKKKDQVISSLQGNYEEEYVFSLRQAMTCLDFYLVQINECDKEIEKLLHKTTQEKSTPTDIKPPKVIKNHKPNIAGLHVLMMKLTDGKDASQIPGLTDQTLMKIVSEVGLDISSWPTVKQFTSWLGLAPNKHQSGKSSKKIRKRFKNRAGQILGSRQKPGQ
ncbi:IS110 family transposase [Dyadobacter sp. LHD-138]|uniref:IS110 family transposase n=1 Tax=Dyadobacter sp. LHD-138 TaxID=3071413 RepID=UPI0027E04AC1|nr:IS110 family transposase [Dyadobacter sp. LHD-138]MDQ6480603.1 IS110 family transposase [Dyadobacter sp. LHD-138]